jgi:methylenetetrahydrofolate dehydrogenase (NADP+)/methenyltetrahydrofolate cyclohydrolase
MIIDGKKIAQDIIEDVKKRVGVLRERGVIPCLGVILAGSDPASASYVAGKEKALAEASMASRDIRLPDSVSQAELVARVAELNSDKTVHGILVQLPLPKHIQESVVIETIDSSKDVDGFHPVSAGNLFLGKKGFLPCTPNGIMYLLRTLNIRTDGAHAVIVGRSNIVGKPLALLLARKDANATVTICHTGTKNLADHTRQADILIAAVGRAGLIGADMVKEGAVVIDVGVNRVPDPAAKKGYRLKGDVDFDAVAEKASYITPVPGGVGPLTIAMLLRNVVTAAEDA